MSVEPAAHPGSARALDPAGPPTPVPSGTASRADGSLAPIRAAIPASCYERSTARGLRAVTVDLGAYLALIALLVVVDGWWVLPLELLAGLAVSGLFVLGHDASHNALTGRDRLNRVLARVLMLPSLHVQEAWVLGHNRVHHGFTARQGMDFVWHPLTATEYQALPAAKRARHRLEWSVLGAGAYYLREVWWNKMITFRPPPNRAAPIRRDWWLVVVWFVLVTAITLAVGGVWLWVKVVVLPFLVFVQIIGWTVHVHHIGPDIRWWTRAEWTRRRAQTESTTVLRMPRPLNLFFHHIFVHVPHHVDTRIPWYHLPEAAAAIESAIPGTVIDRPFRISDYLAATKACKLYDFEAGRWEGYPER